MYPLAGKMPIGLDYLQNGVTLYDSILSKFSRSHENTYLYQQNKYYNSSNNYDYIYSYDQYNHPHEATVGWRNHDNCQDVYRNYRVHDYSCSYSRPNHPASFKRRKVSDTDWAESGRRFYEPCIFSNDPTTCNMVSTSSGPSMNKHYRTTTGKRGRSELENDSDAVLISKEEIDKRSPSRKDGIDVLHETRLRYSYCAFIQNLGMRLDLPQTTIGTSMVLCHRFFFRRSHASHDRFLIASAALFLAAKSEDTPCPLNNVLRASSEIIHRQDLSVLSYMFPIGWFEQYRERLLEAEQLILTTLDFELEVQHPYDPLTSVLSKLGLSQSLLVNLALNLVSEGVLHWIRWSPV